MEVATATATTRAEMEVEAPPALQSDRGNYEAEVKNKAGSSIDVVLLMLSSDGEDEGDDDAATTMGSPVPAAQTLEQASQESVQSISQESVSTMSGGGAWTQRRPLRVDTKPAPSRPSRIAEPASPSGDAWKQRRSLGAAVIAAPSRPKRIDDLFAAVSSVAHFIDDPEEENEHEQEKEKGKEKEKEKDDEKEGEQEKEEGEKPTSKSASEARPTELLLSPASQLHILSQISEMAESRAAREREARAAATSATQPLPATRPRHAWAPIAQTQHQQSLQKEKSSLKRKLPSTEATNTKKSQRTGNTKISARLLADVATWAAFDERILEGDDSEEDAWSFEELSDSDF